MRFRNLKQKIREEINEDPVKKYLLLLLHSGNNKPIDGKTKLMKEFFFISKNVPELEDESDFEADNFGPNSDYVGSILNELTLLKVIQKKGKNYELTEFGEELARELDKDPYINEDLIADMKNLFNGLNEDETLAIVYYTYPETTQESLVKKRIEKKREKLALDLLRKKKVSSAKAAQIAGMPIRSFYKLLQEKGIKVELGY